tara:strand:+ start:788 stop:1225 length:438 start_codon:yes stop_codon:yes gene_type:complete
MTTEYKEGPHDEFIKYLYSSEPHPKGTITLESPLDDPNKNINLHIFEQLLMIFVDGLKFFYANEDGKVNISELTKDNINKMNLYFESMNYKINLEYFETINDYKFKFPNFFKNQEHIKDNTKLEDFYYEVFNENNCVYRISFQCY